MRVVDTIPCNPDGGAVVVEVVVETEDGPEEPEHGRPDIGDDTGVKCKGNAVVALGDDEDEIDEGVLFSPDTGPTLDEST